MKSLHEGLIDVCQLIVSNTLMNYNDHLHKMKQITFCVFAGWSHGPFGSWEEIS